MAAIIPMVTFGHPTSSVLKPININDFKDGNGITRRAADRPASHSPAVLKPINVNDFEVATGIRRRAAGDFSDLDLSTQAQLIYGRPGNDGQLLLANMTLYAPDGLQIVMMERFEPLTSAVDCNGDDGLMSLTFKSQEAFQRALDTWSFINKAQEKQFLLIANHDGCGPQDERQAYRITQVREDPAKLTTFLTAQTAPWSDVAGTYDLDFGRAMTTPKNPQRRGLWDKIQDVGNDVVDTVQDIGSGVADTLGDAGDFIINGDADFSKSVKFPVSMGTPGEAHPIVSTTLFSLNCTDCYVTGSFQVTGHISVQDFSLQDFSLAGSPQGLAAKLELDTKITAPYSPDSLSYTRELFSMGVPEAGISVPKIFDLGAWISYEIGVTTTFSGSANFTFGISASVPDTAVVTANVKDPSLSSATGFDGGQIDPKFDLQGLSAGVTVAAFSQAKLSFGVDIHQVGRLDLAYALKLPGIEAHLKAAYNQAGLCSTEPGASKTGAKLDTDVFVAVDLNLDAKLGSDTTPTLAVRLFKKALPITSNCFPIAIPGIAANSNQTAVTLAASATAAIPTGIATPMTAPLTD
ncbi:MAG: hypothetical protein Q9216_002487 [Gyalolechia sp. 2 TL-2023]